MKILDVGCGNNKYPGAVGMDINPRTAADIIHDCGIVPYPFADNEFDEIVCRHVAEHVPDVMAFIAALHRITRPGGRILIYDMRRRNPSNPDVHPITNAVVSDWFPGCRVQNSAVMNVPLEACVLKNERCAIFVAQPH